MALNIIFTVIIFTVIDIDVNTNINNENNLMTYDVKSTFTFF